MLKLTLFKHFCIPSFEDTVKSTQKKILSSQSLHTYEIDWKSTLYILHTEWYVPKGKLERVLGNCWSACDVHPIVLNFNAASLKRWNISKRMDDVVVGRGRLQAKLEGQLWGRCWRRSWGQISHDLIGSQWEILFKCHGKSLSCLYVKEKWFDLWFNRRTLANAWSLPRGKR